MNDRELRLLLDAAQQAAPEIEAAFLERLQNQALEAQLKSQKDELLAIVQSQQEQIAQLQQMVEQQFAAR